MTRRAFAEERPALEAALLDVAHRAGHEGMTAEPFQRMCGSARGS